MILSRTLIITWPATNTFTKHFKMQLNEKMMSIHHFRIISASFWIYNLGTRPLQIMAFDEIFAIKELFLTSSLNVLNSELMCWLNRRIDPKIFSVGRCAICVHGTIWQLNFTFNIAKCRLPIEEMCCKAEVGIGSGFQGSDSVRSGFRWGSGPTYISFGLQLERKSENHGYYYNKNIPK